MEDAHLAVCPLSNGKNSLFAVFDGHGGNFLLIQVLKYRNSSRDTSSNNYRQTVTTRRVTTN